MKHSFSCLIYYNYHLCNIVADVTLRKPRREFLKSSKTANSGKVVGGISTFLAFCSNKINCFNNFCQISAFYTVIDKKSGNKYGVYGRSE